MNPVLEVPFWAWLVLAGVVVVSLAADLVGHRGDHGQGRKRAVLWSVAWLVVAIAFAGWIALQFGGRVAGEFATAWLVEKSLSVDNLFVFLVVFARFGIPEAEQHRVLFWGILGALVTRGAFIAGGSALLAAWHAVIYPMGAFLIFTGFKTGYERPEATGSGKVFSFVRGHLRCTSRIHGHHFFAMEEGRRLATPLMLALVVIELTDIAFAVDSIPAVFAVTKEPFIVYSSNVFAILGLRALYLVLAALLGALTYLRYGLAALLIFVGVKMLLSSIVHIPHLASLSVIMGILVFTVVSSLLANRRSRAVAVRAA